MIFNWQITRVFPSVRMAGYAPWAPPPELLAGSVLRPVMGLRRGRRGSAWVGTQTSGIGSFVVVATKLIASPRRLRRGASSLGRCQRHHP